ncbi:MAG: right-handed parallel beta-helix repeat-containing protein [Candidatus Korobacteraceae bacterium]
MHREVATNVAHSNEVPLLRRRQVPRLAGLALLAFVLMLASVPASQASAGRLLQVGPTRNLKRPSQAAAAAKNGDTIEIDAGLYLGDVAVWTRDNLTIRGVGGRPRVDARGKSVQGKGIWVIQGTNTTVENMEFSGATVPDQNGAGIRQEGPGLTVRNCYFHDNENGILTGANPSSDILVENSEFARNGYGDGQSHNIYIGDVRTFTLRYSYSHEAKIGHLVKSRAQTNYILYNRLTDETGTASYEIDLPSGGRSYIIGNLIQQSPITDNETIISYAEEGGRNSVQELYIVNNTIVNDYEGGGIFVHVGGLPTVCRLVNNLFIGPGIVLQGRGVQAGNLATRNAHLVNQAEYDYHLSKESPAINKGVRPGVAAGYDLAPMFEYVHPVSKEPRSVVGSAIDIGAYEYDNPGQSPANSIAPPTPAADSSTEQKQKN